MSYEKESVIGQSSVDEIFHVSNATLMTGNVSDEIRKMSGSFAEVLHTETLWAWPSTSIALHQMPCYTTPVPDKMHL